ncbi:DUF916 and DUF3324 domain-containing protein [Enterococcus crotali]|uniref:DUF916 and DUF3324 domain-containing protein n=1 Tax=Enterococcus crotali TaxID=1453587 RepID=UPI00046F3F96|nr:DUF916 and DUF3324 domain-containing protein [Enterococcus crotali]
MKRKIITLTISILYIVGLIIPNQQVFAEESAKQEEKGTASPTGFTYKVIQPENQRNKQVGYFDLHMSPSQKQNVQIELGNDGTQEVEVQVAINGTKTNGNGVIEYGPTGIENDASLKYAFEDLVKGPETVKVPAKGTTMLELAITMPKVEYDGVISGGIQLKNAEDEKVRDKKKGVINEYAFLVGMLLTETDVVVQPDLELNKVTVGLSNYRNSVFVNFSNIQAAYLEDLTVDVQIMKKESDNVLYDAKKANMRVAPNSMVDFPISMNGEKMVPGQYKAHILATTDNKKWEWDEEFSVSDEEADKYNKQDVDLIQENGINWKIIAIVVASVLILIILIFFLVRTMSRKKSKVKSKNKK